MLNSKPETTTCAGWISDNLPEINNETPRMDRGDSYMTGVGPDFYPDVTRPIGFMQRKPRVRVKAWTMPILPKDLT